MKDVEFETPSLDSVPVVNEFLDVFLNNLPNVSPKWEMHFGMYVLTDMQPTNIPPNAMAQDEFDVLTSN